MGYGVRFGVRPPAPQNPLVALMLEVLLVALVLKQRFGVIPPDPLRFMDVESVLGFHLLPFPTPRDRDGQPYKGGGVKNKEGMSTTDPPQTPWRVPIGPPCCTHSLTRVVLELLGLAVLVRANEIPNEGFDAFVAPVVEEAVDQNGPTNGFHVPFRKAAFETPVGEDLPPSTPPGMKGMGGGEMGLGGGYGGAPKHGGSRWGAGRRKGAQMGSPTGRICPWLAPKGLKMVFYPNISSWLAPKRLKMVL